jgi:fructose-1-phosphate kinase PfkB-like protein
MLYTLSTNPALDLTLTVPQIQLGPVLRAARASMSRAHCKGSVRKT